MTLIEKLEAAEGPSRDLDADIWDAVDQPGGDSHFIPHYTASIDAALTLVPEGWHFRVETWTQNAGKLVGEAEIWLNDDDMPEAGMAWHPAIALCIAALKARHA